MEVPTLTAITQGLSGFEIAQAVAKIHGSPAATQFYACGYGINELLQCSFKLHDANKVDDHVLVDPWEVILAELSFAFDAPMLVARVKADGGGPFERTNVTDREFFAFFGRYPDQPEGRTSSPNGHCPTGVLAGLARTQPSPILPGAVTDGLQQFFNSHAASAPAATPPLGWACSEEHAGRIAHALSLERSRYDECLNALRHEDGNDRRTTLCANLLIQDPRLLAISHVACFALYHYRKWVDDRQPRFVGTVQIFLPAERRSAMPPPTAGIMGHLSLLFTVSTSSLICRDGGDFRRGDFDSYSQAPLAPIEHLPTFAEYQNDLKQKIASELDIRDSRPETSSGNSDGTEPRPASVLESVIDDLYLQIRRSALRYGRIENLQVAFVVPFDGAGHYYFPSSFVKEVLYQCRKDREKQRQRAASLKFLAGIDTSREQSVPLDRGLLGYVRDTYFPTRTTNLDEDARIQAYANAELFQHERAVFLDQGDVHHVQELTAPADGHQPGRTQLDEVIEVPLVLFEQTDADGARRILPTSMVLFVWNNRDKSAGRSLHHLYALAYHSRYALSKAFQAESAREAEIQRLRAVVQEEQYRILLAALTHPAKNFALSLEPVIEAKNALIHPSQGDTPHLTLDAEWKAPRFILAAYGAQYLQETIPLVQRLAKQAASSDELLGGMPVWESPVRLLQEAAQRALQHWLVIQRADHRLRDWEEFVKWASVQLIRLAAYLKEGTPPGAAKLPRYLLSWENSYTTPSNLLTQTCVQFVNEIVSGQIQSVGPAKVLLFKTPVLAVLEELIFNALRGMAALYLEPGDRRVASLSCGISAKFSEDVWEFSVENSGKLDELRNNRQEASTAGGLRAAEMILKRLYPMGPSYDNGERVAITGEESNTQCIVSVRLTSLPSGG